MHRTATRRRWKATAFVASLTLAGVALPATPGSGLTGMSATALRVIGGPGHAGLYGWGADTMSDGSVIISDYWNYRVQQYEKDGTLRRTVVAKDGHHQAPFDVAVDRRDDSVYVSDTDGGRNIDKYDRYGTYLFSFGSQSDFKYPSWLDVDSTGRVAIADGHDNKVVVFDSKGTKLFQFGTAGTAPGQFKAPRGVGFDANNNLYVADTTNSRIQVFALGVNSATLLRWWADTGDFRGLTVDKVKGWVYVVNAGKGTIDKFDLLGTRLGTFGGWGTGPGKFLDGGRGATVDGDGNVWVGDMPNFRAQKFSPTGQFLLQAPSPAQPPPPGGFAMPGSAAVDSAGNLFVIDTYNWRVQKLAADGTFVRQWGRRGGGVDQFGLQYPRGVAVDRRDGTVVVADTDNSTIKKYTSDGAFLWGNTGTFKAFDVAVGPTGTIYAADFAQNVVKMLTPSGASAGSFGAGALSNPRGIDVDADGSVWVTSRGTGTVSHFSAAGSLLGKFGALGSGAGLLAQAAGVAVDATHVFVADQTANTIKVWSKSGTFLGSFGSGGTALGRMQGPVGLEMGPNGHLYVTEMTGERVQEFTITG
jgi:tripartite motif-containing protein 71